MSDADYERWQEIVDREVLGEPISAADAAFRRDFERKRPLCARESTAWEAMLGTLAHAHSSDLETGRQQLIDSVLANVDNPSFGTSDRVIPLKQPTKRPWYAAIAAVAAAAAAIVAWPTSPAEQSPSPSSLAQLADTPAPDGEQPKAAEQPEQPDHPVVHKQREPVAPRVTFVGGQNPTHVGEAIALNTRHTAQSDLCFVYQQPFAAVCVERGSEFTLGIDAETRRIELGRGRVVANLDKLPEGQHFVVASPTSSATAIGTIFDVHHDDTGSQVTVHEGTVGVSSESRREVLVHANMTIDERSQAPTAASPDPWSTSRAALGNLWRGSEVEAFAQLNLPDRGGNSYLLDTVVVGPSGSLLAPAGQHQLSVRGTRGEHTIELTRGDPTEASLPAALAPTPKPKRAKPVDTVADLKAAVRSARQARDWSRAAKLLAKLIEAAPASAVAQTSRVQLGDLFRVHLADPSSALENYRAYLRRGGPLAREARSGEIRALRSLGRKSEEKAAIGRFLAEFPNSLEAKVMRKRLAEL